MDLRSLCYDSRIESTESNDWLRMDSSRIRRAQLADADALASCVDAAYAQYANRIKDLPLVSAGCAEAIAKDQVWVAVEDDEITGGLFLVAQDGFMKLANVAVHPDHSGKGLGRELINLSESEAKKQEYSEMRLNTHVAMPENLQLYIHLGWEEFARNGNTVSMRKFL
jgi:GNAT superfamily N-acetyltransferase